VENLRLMTRGILNKQQASHVEACFAYCTIFFVRKVFK